jgi:K+-transporting ATPase ATPase A chain
MDTGVTLEILFYLALLIGLAPVLGRWLAWVFQSQRPLPGESVLTGDTSRTMNWWEYTKAILWLHGIGLVLLLFLQCFQAWLPGNPQALPNVPFDLALNTAISFLTNTNWQAYSGEATMSHLTQMLGLGVQNFLSAATGMAVAAALARGLAATGGSGLGNFWRDVSRATLYILLPLSIVFSVVLVQQGVPQTFASYAQATTLEGKTQVIPLGPAASQIAIKQLGTNGGGFFGVNSAHPFENPTSLTNFLQCFAILALAAGFPFLLGRITGQPRHGWCLFFTMLVLLLAGLGVALWAEHQPNHALGGRAMLEGKESRFSTAESVLWAITTTAASNGSVNAMHDSLMPLSGGVALVNMLLGEIIFGGVGSGLYGMVMFVVLTVFLAGLMVGRTPEYLGKRIEAREVICATVAVILPSLMVLIGTSLTVLTSGGRASLTNAGPHGFSEALYAWASAANNNGSAFGGLSANVPFYNYGLSLAMLVGRFGVIVPTLMLAGSMAQKRFAEPGPGTFPTDGGLFIILLLGVILIVGGLTFLPALSLGPIVEHLLLSSGRGF